ncbi:MAG: glycogen/starch/alpha-glucan phosphorylase [Planctomycetota bacterium]|nr:glycogen/starch/alpha-glucan phosphorylase [Planctomycetota bacterium]
MARRVVRDDDQAGLSGSDAESLKRGFAHHLKYELARDHFTATQHDRYVALARTIRDRLIERWIETQQAHHKRRAKRVYYLSLEFLMGRALSNNVINLGLEKELQKALGELGLDWRALQEEEVDPGLGNGGLGRLAACFLDSLAALQYPAFGYGIRYDFGIFTQRIENGYQVEKPDDWLRGGNPWEIPRPDFRIPVNFGGRVEMTRDGSRLKVRWVDTKPVIGVPYDTPIVGYGGNTVNTLRLWSARAAEEFHLDDFNAGDYVAAVEYKVAAENLTKVLYPNDNVYAGRELRLKQQYFFVACSLHDILRRFREDCADWSRLPDHVAIQMNDTHPSLAVPELMRLLMDREGLEWEQAWDLTVRTLGYTNHTLLPEALERWPVDLMERLLPRHLQIIYEINRRFLDQVAARFPGDAARGQRMSVIEEGAVRQVRMAHLCVVGSHSTNGVARLHSELLKTRVLADFHNLYPERFNNKTNGITQRRWLLNANPALAAMITEAIGDEWITNLTELKKLVPLAEDASFRERFRQVKRANKAALAQHLADEHGFILDPDSLFDVQAKRLHEYKRQLLNVLHIVVLYNRLRQDPGLALQPRTFLFAAKAAPGYYLAKMIIKLINNVGKVINSDPVAAGRLKVFFLPNYGVTLAERLIPAADVSEQISTAGTEASGTGNMKFMLNGALTLGTLDGANIEILEEVGRDNFFLFGMTTDEVARLAPTYNPWDCYRRDEETRAALDLISSGHFNPGEPGIFEPIRQALLERGDRYMHLADLPSYAQAQAAVEALYKDRDAWMRKAILNVACSGKFSSDRAITEYARDIWDVKPVFLEKDHKLSLTLVEARVSPRKRLAPKSGTPTDGLGTGEDGRG